MADKFITELDAITTFSDTDYAVVETDPTGTAETNYITLSNFISELLKRNTYTISRTVSSNNLIVALKNADGNDATTAAPVRIQIGNTYRSIDGALSVQVNAGASTFALGGTQFAALENDIFVYVGYRAASATVFIGISRIPYGVTYADFSSTATNAKYLAYSGSAPATTDEVVNIGRVNVTNSGTASYNWSVPATSVVINTPILETRWLPYTMAWTGSVSDPTLSNGTLEAYYKVQGNSCFVKLRVSFGSSTNAGSGTYSFSTPFTALHLSSGVSMESASGNILNAGTRYAISSFIRTSDIRGIYGNAILSSTTLTWANTDQINLSGWYEI